MERRRRRCSLMRFVFDKANFDGLGEPVTPSPRHPNSDQLGDLMVGWLVTDGMTNWVTG